MASSNKHRPVAFAMAAVLGASVVAAPLREARADDVSPTGKGIVGGSLLGSLFEGALVERGGTLEPSFGAPSLVVRFEGEGVPAAKIARDAMHHDGAKALLGQWAERLGAPA